MVDDLGSRCGEMAAVVPASAARVDSGGNRAVVGAAGGCVTAIDNSCDMGAGICIGIGHRSGDEVENKSKAAAAAAATLDGGGVIVAPPLVVIGGVEADETLSAARESSLLVSTATRLEVSAITIDRRFAGVEPLISLLSSSESPCARFGVYKIVSFLTVVTLLLTINSSPVVSTCSSPFSSCLVK